jgi:hypothetical protein
MAKLARILKTDIMGDLSALAQLLQSKGRGKDTILAHITPAEAKRLKAAGGRGSRNPDTGLLEFGDGPDAVPVNPDVPAPPAGGGDLGEVTVTGTPTGGGSSGTYSNYDVGPAGTYSPAVQNIAAGNVDYSLSAAPMAQAMGGPSSIGQPLTPELPTPPALSMQNLEQDITEKAKAAAAPTTLQKIEQALGGPQGLARLGIAGIGGLAGLIQSRKAATQAEQAQAQEQALAQPYQEQGRSLTGAAARGELSPASLQAYQAAQARMQQQSAATGGVGVEQQAAQLEAFRQQLLANQYDLGLKVSSIGDQIAIGALRSGMTADAALAQANQNFYTALASIATGLPTSGYRPTG